MLGKDFTLGAVLQMANWGQACSPAILFQIVPHFGTKLMVLLLTAVGAGLFMTGRRRRQNALWFCLFLGLPCLVIGALAAYRDYLGVRSVITQSGVPIKLDSLQEAATSIVEPLIVGTLGLLVNSVLGAATRLWGDRQ